MSARVRLVGTFVLVMFAFACSGSPPTAPEMVTEPVSGAFVGSENASGCYAVKFNVSGIDPVFVVTGDLVGTTAFLFDGDMKFTLQIAPEDCTGCAMCIEACPVKNKQNTSLKAINMETLMRLMP